MNTLQSEFVLGTNINRIRNNVIVAPCWLPKTVGITECKKIADGSCQIWDCSIESNRFTYIVMGIGAASCIDVVYALKNTHCKSVMFLGSAGALKHGVNIGDFAVPYCVKSAEGASRFIGDKLKDDVYGQAFFSSDKLTSAIGECLKEITDSFNVKAYTGIGISVESILLQYKHLDEFSLMECDFIDMEASAFLAACNSLGFLCAVVFCISDNVIDNKPLYNLDPAETLFRKKVRNNILPYVIKEFLNYEL